ncbi:MAG: hypothetical protein AAB642_01145 [Patescibacteria group bacterium]
MFSDAQLKFITDILAGLGQVFFASLVVPYVVSDVSGEFLSSGIILSFGSWVSGLIITQKIKTNN